MIVSQSKKNPILWWTTGFLSAVVLFLFGTLWMASTVYSKLPNPAKLGPEFRPADVIVCLTGGRGRIRRSLELFEKGYGKILYISGIDPHVHLKDIIKESRWSGKLDQTRIILEHISTNTMENANQVANFLKERNLQSVLLVTSIYHVRRAHFIFRKVLPSSVHLEVTWFEREPFDVDDWWKKRNGIFVTVTEFFKFFYAYLRLPNR